MRCLIVLALIVAIANAAPLHDEPELEGTEPTVKVFKEHQKKSVEIAKKDDDASKTKSSEHHSEKKYVEDDVEEEETDFDNNDDDQESDGVEMIALFAMKVQPAQHTSLFEYPMVLPVGLFGGPYNYYDHKHHDRSVAVGYTKL